MVKMIIDIQNYSDIIILGGINWDQHPFQRIDGGRFTNFSGVREW